jgi:hypothetical protein
MTLFSRIFCCLFGVFAGSVAQAQRTALYVAPAADHRPIAQVSPTSSALDKATPVLEAAKKAEGWFWAEYSGPFEGFIEERDLGPDERPGLGAIVFAEPRTDAPIITTVEQGDRGALAGETAVGGFIRISLNKKIGVYYNERLAPAPAAVATPARQAEPSPPPSPRAQVRERTTPSGAEESANASGVVPPPVMGRGTPPPARQTPPPSAPPAGRSTVTLPEAPPVSAPPVSAPPPRIPAPAPRTESPPPPAPVRETASPARPTRDRVPGEPVPRVTVYERPIGPEPTVLEKSVNLRGILRQSKRRWLVVTPPQPYELVTVDGDRIAYLDLSRAVFNRPLPDLLDREVSVFGEFKLVDGRNEMVLITRNLRLAL